MKNLNRLGENSEYEVSFDKTRPNVGVRTLTKAVQKHLPKNYTALPSPPSSPNSTDQSKVEMIKKVGKALQQNLGSSSRFAFG